MTVSLRQPDISDCTALSALATRSKAYWGYDADFMRACAEELTVTPDLITDDMIVAEQEGHPIGFAYLTWQDGRPELGAMYVDPTFIGSGLGRRLFDWCVTRARRKDAAEMFIDADPNAEAFYRHLGARRIGLSPSGSIPGRMLPQLTYPL